MKALFTLCLFLLTIVFPSQPADSAFNYNADSLVSRSENRLDSNIRYKRIYLSFDFVRFEKLGFFYNSRNFIMSVETLRRNQEFSLRANFKKSVISCNEDEYRINIQHFKNQRIYLTDLEPAAYLILAEIDDL